MKTAQLRSLLLRSSKPGGAHLLLLKRIIRYSALIAIAIIFAVAAFSAPSVGQSAGATFTKVEIQGTATGHAGDTLTFTCKVSNCTQLINATACQEIRPDLPVVFYVEAPSPSDNQVQQLTFNDGQPQASFTFSKPGQYVVSAIVGERADKMVVKIAPSEGQNQSTGEPNAASSPSSDWLWILALGVTILVAIIIVVLLVRRRRRGSDESEDEHG